MIKQSDVTIIIPHLGGNEESINALRECLLSLEETSTSQIIVAKNGKTPIAFDDRGRNKSIWIEEQGQCKAVNAAVATTNTPWIFVTNDDMVYAPGWWDKVNDLLNKTTFPLINRTFSPILVEPRPGAPTFETYFCGGAGGDFDKQKFLDYEKNMYEKDQHTSAQIGRKVDRSGFNLPFLISRDLWDTIGGYDINYDPWGSNSDSDLEYKIKLAGGYSLQITDWRVYHFSQTSGTFEPRNDEYRFKNYEYFKQKWGFDRTDDGIWEATFKIPTKEEGRIFNPSWEGKYGN